MVAGVRLEPHDLRVMRLAESSGITNPVRQLPNHSCFKTLLWVLAQNDPIFVRKERVYNSTVNDILARHCTRANIPVISIHGLRYTHASLLLFAGVSIASVARRLGHSSMTTTQKTYLHVIQELENQDVDLVMRSLSNLS